MSAMAPTVYGRAGGVFEVHRERQILRLNEAQ